MAKSNGATIHLAAAAATFTVAEVDELAAKLQPSWEWMFGEPRKAAAPEGDLFPDVVAPDEAATTELSVANLARDFAPKRAPANPTMEVGVEDLVNEYPAAQAKPPRRPADYDPSEAAMTTEMRVDKLARGPVAFPSHFEVPLPAPAQAPLKLQSLPRAAADGDEPVTLPVARNPWPKIAIALGGALVVAIAAFVFTRGGDKPAATAASAAAPTSAPTAAAQKVEPAQAKPEAKPEAKEAKAEPEAKEPAKDEPAKPEPAKPEAAKPEPKPEPAKPEPVAAKAPPPAPWDNPTPSKPAPSKPVAKPAPSKPSKGGIMTDVPF